MRKIDHKGNMLQGRHRRFQIPSTGECSGCLDACFLGASSLVLYKTGYFIAESSKSPKI